LYIIFLYQGEGKVIITATVEDKMQTVRLPLIEHEDAFWDFMEILFEELRCGMFYTREKRPEPKSKKRRSSTETSVTPSLESGAQKRQRVQVSLERMNLKKSLLSLGKERMVRNDDSTTAAAATGSTSSSSSSPVHSPAAAQSVSPASSTASSRQDGVANRSTIDFYVADSCLRMSVRRSKKIVFPEPSSLAMILMLSDWVPTGTYIRVCSGYSKDLVVSH
jgi:hypothetical protein